MFFYKKGDNSSSLLFSRFTSQIQLFLQLGTTLISQEGFADFLKLLLAGYSSNWKLHQQAVSTLHNL